MKGPKQSGNDSPPPGRIGIEHRTQASHIPEDSMHSKLLLWLLHHPMQRIEDMALGLQVSYAIIHRHLALLEQNHLVECLVPAIRVGIKARWFYLSNTGVLAAARQEGADARRLARAWGADERGLLHLLPRFHFLASLQKIVNSLVVYAPTIFAHPGGRRAMLSWTWTRDYRHRFLFHKHPAGCQADAVIVFQRRSQTSQESREPSLPFYGCFLFLDTDPTSVLDRTMITTRLL